jgi:uncharacterized OB-fold protein
MSQAKALLPPIDAQNAPFWEAAKKGELVIQSCAKCARWLHPPRPMCPDCHSLQQVWKRVSGRGTIWSYVVPHPPLLPEFMDVAPFPVITVALDEDPTVRLLGNLVKGPGGAINEIEPSSIRIGEPVRVIFEPLTPEVHLPRWVRA